MVSLSSIEKDSITTNRDSFKDNIHSCKVRNQMHTNFVKTKVPILLKNGCSVKHMFYTIFAPLSVAKNLGKHVQSSL